MSCKVEEPLHKGNRGYEKQKAAADYYSATPSLILETGIRGPGMSNLYKNVRNMLPVVYKMQRFPRLV